MGGQLLKMMTMMTIMMMIEMIENDDNRTHDGDYMTPGCSAIPQMARAR